MVKELLSNLLEGSRKTGLYADRAARWENMLLLLPEYAVNDEDAMAIVRCTPFKPWQKHALWAICLRFTMIGAVCRMGPVSCADFRVAPFQIDGNIGLAAAINEMMMQCDDERIIVLPALPSEWKQGEIQGLLAPGKLFVISVGTLKQFNCAWLPKSLFQKQYVFVTMRRFC